MANKVQRGEPMKESIIIKVTQSDKIGIELACKQRGVNMSQLIRDLMVRERIIQPAYPELA